jgi:hypothetical protein
MRGLRPVPAGRISLVLAGAFHHLGLRITADLKVITDGRRATHLGEDLAYCFRPRCSNERPLSPVKRMCLNVILAIRVRNESGLLSYGWRMHEKFRLLYWIL